MEAGFQREDENGVSANRKKSSCAKDVKNPIRCEIDFDGNLTSEAYCKLVAETIKYVLYSRGQLPLQCDLLFKLYLPTAKDVDGERNGQRSCPNAPRPSSHTRKMKQTVINIKELLDQIDRLFEKNDTCQIQEFLIIIGATPVSPKNTYNIILPAQCSRQSAAGLCPIRRCLVQMFRKLVMMEELSGLPSVCPTNTYLFVKMRRSASEKWFVPKPDFKPFASRGLWILFIFRANSDQSDVPSEPIKDQDVLCNASGLVSVRENKSFEIFSESEMQVDRGEGHLSHCDIEQVPITEAQNSLLLESVDNISSDLRHLELVAETLEKDDEESFIWYQSPVVIKGITGESPDSGANWL